MTINESEAFVLHVCHSSFLSLWCYQNPRAKSGKELCDILVVFGPHVIVISVKAITLKNSGNRDVAYDRWGREAIDKSIKQIYGAERWLKSASRVIRHDGSPGLELPSASERRIHRIAIAFGGEGEVGIRSGDMGKGYVNVLTEESFSAILSELDTISDFVAYLEAKSRKNCAVIMLGSEADLLGWYVYNGRSFPPKTDMILVDEGIWESIQKKPDFRRRKEADKDSYVWDNMISFMGGGDGSGFTDPAAILTNLEFSLRAMAQENRFARRIFGRGTREFLEQTQIGALRSRILSSNLSSTVYVLTYFQNGESVERRNAELVNRCFVARNTLPHSKIVVGIGISKHLPDIGQTFDLIHCNWIEWSDEQAKQAAEIQSQLGYYTKAAVTRADEDEFPLKSSKKTRAPHRPGNKKKSRTSASPRPPKRKRIED